MTNATDENVVDVVEDDTRYPDGTLKMVPVAFVGGKGFRISKPPIDPTRSDQRSFFHIPQGLGSPFQQGFVDAVGSRPFGSKQMYSAERDTLVATENPHTKTREEIYRYRNFYLPELLFKPRCITLVPIWLADIICDEKLTEGNFVNASEDAPQSDRFSNWPFADTEPEKIVVSGEPPKRTRRTAAQIRKDEAADAEKKKKDKAEKEETEETEEETEDPPSDDDDSAGKKKEEKVDF